MPRVMKFQQSEEFAKSVNNTFYEVSSNTFFDMTLQQAQRKVYKDTEWLRNAQVTAAWATGTGAVGGFVYGAGCGLDFLWQNSPSFADVAQLLVDAGQKGVEALQYGGEALSLGGGVAAVDPTGTAAVVGGFIFLCRSGLIIHNLQNIDNAMPGSHHNCDHYNLTKVRNCLFEALYIMIQNGKEEYSDEEIQESVDKVNKNRTVKNDPNKTEIDGFNSFVLKKILKEIVNNREILRGMSDGGLDYSKLIQFLTISKSNLGPLDFDKLSSEYGIHQSTASKMKAGAGGVRALVASSLYCFGRNK